MRAVPAARFLPTTYAMGVRGTASPSPSLSRMSPSSRCSDWRLSRDGLTDGCGPPARAGMGWMDGQRVQSDAIQ
jgi:hypothetical protein